VTTTSDDDDQNDDQNDDRSDDEDARGDDQAAAATAQPGSAPEIADGEESAAPREAGRGRRRQRPAPAEDEGEDSGRTAAATELPQEAHTPPANTRRRPRRDRSEAGPVLAGGDPTTDAPAPAPAPASATEPAAADTDPEDPTLRRPWSDEPAASAEASTSPQATGAGTDEAPQSVSNGEAAQQEPGEEPVIPRKAEPEAPLEAESGAEVIEAATEVEVEAEVEVKAPPAAEDAVATTAAEASDAETADAPSAGHRAANDPRNRQQPASGRVVIEDAPPARASRPAVTADPIPVQPREAAEGPRAANDPRLRRKAAATETEPESGDESEADSSTASGSN